MMLHQQIGPTKQVSDTNPFVVEYRRGDWVQYTEPNWALIIPLAVVFLTAIVTVCMLLYRNWRKNNCYPIYFAGKVKYARKGDTIARACESAALFENDWITERCHQLDSQGYRISALYTDAAHTKSLDEKQIVTGPVHIFPKLQK